MITDLTQPTADTANDSFLRFSYYHLT